jgi:predicted  nucleic acid-binding Zn-ribbon protein
MADSTLDGLKKELDAINKKAEPLRVERDKLANSIRPTEYKIRDLNHQIRAIEMPRKGELEKMIAALS